jgi:AmmeMemoRadiSam system protein B
VIGPSHKFWFKGVAVCDYDEWQTPLGSIKLGKEPAQDVDFVVNNDAFDEEHCIEVQLPFLRTVLKNFTLYPFITGEISDYASLAKNIAKYIDDKTLLVVSSDLSHYQPYEKAQLLDEVTTGEIGMLKGIINHEQACGADGINVLMHLAREYDWKPVLLDQRNSGDTAGEKDEVVGYTAFSFVKY